MSTKDYPLDYIQALHLLTGEEPVAIESLEGTFRRQGEFILTDFSTAPMRHTIREFIFRFSHFNFRIYEPPKPPKLEPVELCEEIKRHGYSNYEFYGLIIAQAVRMAREEREAEKKGEGK